MWQVKDNEELGAVADVEPHPVTVRLQTHRLEPKKLEEVGSSAGPPVGVGLVLVEEARAVLLGVIVVRVGAAASSFIVHFNI